MYILSPDDGRDRSLLELPLSSLYKKILNMAIKNNIDYSDLNLLNFLVGLTFY